jgi:hypothetical protein
VPSVCSSLKVKLIGGGSPRDVANARGP